MASLMSNFLENLVQTFRMVENWLFSPGGLTPHGFCLLWEPGLLWLYGGSGIVIGLTYFSIPAALVIFHRKRRDLIHAPVLWLFVAFIVLCGLTHWLDVLTLWVPAYGLEAITKFATAAVSLTTAIALWAFLPKMLSMPSAADLRELQEAHLTLRVEKFVTAKLPSLERPEESPAG